MIKCNEDCIPCCDFCIYAEHEMLEDNIIGGPIGCRLHPEQEYQWKAEACSYCKNFHCFNVED